MAEIKKIGFAGTTPAGRITKDALAPTPADEKTRAIGAVALLAAVFAGAYYLSQHADDEMIDDYIGDGDDGENDE